MASNHPDAEQGGKQDGHVEGTPHGRQGRLRGELHAGNFIAPEPAGFEQVDQMQDHRDAGNPEVNHPLDAGDWPGAVLRTA